MEIVLIHHLKRLTHKFFRNENKRLNEVVAHKTKWLQKKYQSKTNEPNFSAFV